MSPHPARGLHRVATTLLALLVLVLCALVPIRTEAADIPVVVAGQPDGTATVDFQADREGLTLAIITGHSSAVAYGGGFSAVAVGTSWKDVCDAPCRFDVPAGRYELSIYGRGATPVNRTLQLDPGVHRLSAKTGPLVLRRIGLYGMLWGIGCVAGGATAAILGRGGPMVPVGIALSGGGAALVGGGAAMFVVGRSRLDHE